MSVDVTSQALRLIKNLSDRPHSGFPEAFSRAHSGTALPEVECGYWQKEVKSTFIWERNFQIFLDENCKGGNGGENILTRKEIYF